MVAKGLEPQCARGQGTAGEVKASRGHFFVFVGNKGTGCWSFYIALTVATWGSREWRTAGFVREGANGVCYPFWILTSLVSSPHVPV